MTTLPSSINEPVLVTGASGFTGGHLALELARRGIAVRALVRPGVQTSALADAGVTIITGQLTDRDDVCRAAEGAATIFHIAAAYRTARQPERYYHDVNVGGTRHIIEAAKRNNARLVHCSTGGVHGHITNGPATEDAPFNPGDIYQISKLEAERHIQAAMQDGLPCTIVRPGAIYGPGDMRLLKLFRAVQRRRFIMFGDGSIRYHLVYIDDLVDGFLRCASMDQAIGQTFILAGPRSTTLGELTTLIAGAVGVAPPRRHLPLWPLLLSAAACEALCRPLRIEPPLHRRRADFFVKNRDFSIDKARRELCWEPRITPEEGLIRTARWYMQEGLLAPIPSEPSMPRGITQEVPS